MLVVKSSAYQQASLPPSALSYFQFECFYWVTCFLISHNQWLSGHFPFICDHFCLQEHVQADACNFVHFVIQDVNQWLISLKQLQKGCKTCSYISNKVKVYKCFLVFKARLYPSVSRLGWWNLLFFASWSRSNSATHHTAQLFFCRRTLGTTTTANRF